MKVSELIESASDDYENNYKGWVRHDPEGKYAIVDAYDQLETMVLDRGIDSNEALDFVVSKYKLDNQARMTLVKWLEHDMNTPEEEEEWHVKHTGQNTDQSIATLRKQKTAAKRSGNVTRERQKNFAIMAKSHWK